MLARRIGTLEDILLQDNVLQEMCVSGEIDRRTAKLLACLSKWADTIIHTGSSIQRSIANGASILSRNQGTRKCGQGRERRQGEGGKLHCCESKAE